METLNKIKRWVLVLRRHRNYPDGLLACLKVLKEDQEGTVISALYHYGPNKEFYLTPDDIEAEYPIEALPVEWIDHHQPYYPTTLKDKVKVMLNREIPTMKKVIPEEESLVILEFLSDNYGVAIFKEGCWKGIGEFEPKTAPQRWAYLPKNRILC